MKTVILIISVLMLMSGCASVSCDSVTYDCERFSKVSRSNGTSDYERCKRYEQEVIESCKMMPSSNKSTCIMIINGSRDEILNGFKSVN